MNETILLYIVGMKITCFLFLLIVFLGAGITRSWGDGVSAVGPQDTKIEGAIKYSVIGTYRAEFNKFKGRIALDDNWQKVKSVYLEIEVRSIHSNCRWCDKFARSRRLLNALRYPKIIFKGDRIVQHDKAYKVTGILEMHGIKRRLTFPFSVQVLTDQKTKHKVLILTGNWSINRKDFNIVWNKLLDHGGVLVGDNFTVNWGIKAALL